MHINQLQLTIRGCSGYEWWQICPPRIEIQVPKCKHHYYTKHYNQTCFWVWFSLCSMSCCSVVSKFNPCIHQPCMIATQPPQLMLCHDTRLSQHASTIQMLPYTRHGQNSATSYLVSTTVFHRLAAAAANTTIATGLRCSPNPVLTIPYLPAAWLTPTKLYNSFVTWVLLRG